MRIENMSTDTYQGIPWEAYDDLELSARETVTSQLMVFLPIVKNCYELGVQAPTLKCPRKSERDMLVAGLFLKKSLNDFRSVWILLTTGYTSQAAAVAASMFEILSR
jgi:hypothetical protein